MDDTQISHIDHPKFDNANVEYDGPEGTIKRGDYRAWAHFVKTGKILKRKGTHHNQTKKRKIS